MCQPPLSLISPQSCIFAIVYPWTLLCFLSWQILWGSWWLDYALSNPLMSFKVTTYMGRSFRPKLRVAASFLGEGFSPSLNKTNKIISITKNTSYRVWLRKVIGNSSLVFQSSGKELATIWIVIAILWLLEPTLCW